MKILVSHPTLNSNSKNLVLGLLKHKLLFKLFTAVAIFPDQILYKLGNYNLFKDLNRRSLDRSWQPFTKARPFFEVCRLLSSKFNLHFLTTHESGLFSIDNIYQMHDQWVAASLEKAKKNGLSGVYGYEDGALATFKVAKQLQLYCIYELPIGYWKSARLYMQQELDVNPAWSTTLTGFSDSDAKLNKKDKELALADIIFVSSSFTKKTLRDFSGHLAEIKVIPYGFPEVKYRERYEPLTGRKLKILFVGGLSQRKGLSYLFEAVSGLHEKIELTVIGRKVISDCQVLNKALEQHHWIESLSHQEVLECMRKQDVLIFPSLFEGFGLVITEAMSQGVPVITTERTAGPDLITHGEDGWIVPAASSHDIKKVFIQIFERPEILEQFGRSSQIKAKLRPWSAYGQEMAEAISSLKFS